MQVLVNHQKTYIHCTQKLKVNVVDTSRWRLRFPWKKEDQVRTVSGPALCPKQLQTWQMHRAYTKSQCIQISLHLWNFWFTRTWWWEVDDLVLWIKRYKLFYFERKKQSIQWHKVPKNLSFIREISLNFSSASTCWMSDFNARSGWNLNKARLYAACTWTGQTKPLIKYQNSTWEHAVDLYASTMFYKR